VLETRSISFSAREAWLGHMDFAEPLIPFAETRSEQGARRVAWAQGLALTSLLVCVAQLPGLAAPELAGAPLVLASGPVGLGGYLGSLGTFLRQYYDSLVPYVWLINYCGIVLFVLLFVMSFLNHAKDFSGFVKMMEAFGLPCPAFMALGGLFSLLAGSFCYLTGIPVLMEWGAEFLLMFLIASTYFGHYKPWKQSKDMSHFIMILKNIGLSGHCLLTIGFEVPEIGKDGTPLGLHGALGSVGVFIGKIYVFFRPYSFILKYTGLVLFVVPFVLSFLNHAKDTKQFVGMIMGFGFGRTTATALAVLTLILLSVSSIFYVSGIPVLMELGAEGLFTFLLFATYFGHLKPYLQSGDMGHFLNILKNVSLAGACLMTMGVVIPQIGPS